jgi:type 1 glutamine amidotransferase
MRPALAALLLLACGGDDAGQTPRADGPPAGQDAAGPDSVTDAATTDAPPARVLVFSRTTGFRHASIPDGITALADLGAAAGFVTEATEDPAVFAEASLAPFDVVVFLMTTGDVLDPAGEAALEAWVRAGGGWVGIHSAADTEYDWPFYGDLVGAWFDSHPAIQEATIHVEDARHPATSTLPSPWVRTDEWYNFRTNPRATVHVLLTLDESTYSGGTMGTDHPHAWCRLLDGGRSFYIAGGHTSESYGGPAFRSLLAGAVAWASGRADAACDP